MKKEEILNKGLGRVYIQDNRDRVFPMKSIIPKKQTINRTFKYWWTSGWWGDQGESPQCVAYSWIHWLEDGGVTQNITEPPVLKPSLVYKQAKLVDEWPGTSYDGTSVRAGAKILMKEGFIKEYRWTTSVEELAMAVLTKAPVVVGTNWYHDMFFPDKDGVIKVGGEISGGHAYVINGVNLKTKMFRIKNSWSRDWGKKGYAYISFNDMQRLLNEYGEACLAVEIKKSRYTETVED